jgi:hypothetical protein
MFPIRLKRCQRRHLIPMDLRRSLDILGFLARIRDCFCAAVAG